ncbi:unnamed protein product [Rhizoctonia solani]|uniref:Peptidase C14 caspase domain-containing protein n=1 Tax=Rhizoctonia solani TaxID=456999 RepID=A0A8H3CS18_9AGAM|nr:unnamed protein product [Rhizoctonia solani]
MEEYYYSSTHIAGHTAEASKIRGPVQTGAGIGERAPAFPIQGDNVEVVTGGLIDLITAIKASTRPKETKYGTEPEARAKRRALLVGVQYELWSKKSSSSWGTLPSTPYDVLRIYNMLRDQGYQEPNFRILVEGIVSDDRCTPTKSNIMEGLEWLVQGAQPGDYRYFHFSGHGDAFETTKEVGKEARRIPGGRFAPGKDDPERISFGSKKSDQINKRIKEQEINEGDITYYNEALVTTYSTPLHELTDPVERENYNRVRDEDLNAVFAKLPEGCIITVQLTRLWLKANLMLSFLRRPDHPRYNNLKLLGSGFRGRLLGSNEETTLQGPLSKLPGDESLNKVTVEDGKVLRDGTLDKRAIFIDVLAPLDQGALSPSRRGKVDTDVERNAMTIGLPRVIRKVLLDNHTPPRNYVLPPRINQIEKLPSNEASRDNIKATMV